MTSAVHWFEAARSGALERNRQDIALRRCVLRSDPRTIDISRLPAGLSAALQSRHPGLSSWDVVPIKAKPSRSALEHVAQGSSDVGLSRRLVVAALHSSRSVDQPSLTQDLHTAVDRSRGRITSRAIPINRVNSPSLASTSMASIASNVAASGVSTATKLAVAEPSRLAGPVNEQQAASRKASTTPAPTRLRLSNVLPRLIGDKTSRLPASDAPPIMRSLRPSAEPLENLAKTVDMTLTTGASRKKSSSAQLRSSLTRSTASRPDAGSKIKPPIIANRQPVAMTASAARILASGSQQGHGVVPRRVIKPADDPRIAQAASTTWSAATGSPRSPKSSYQTPSAGVSSYANTSAAQAEQAGMMVTLHGDILMDGRKMGKLVATGQTSAASLPTPSGSVINLRAMPIFAGTSAPL